MSEIFGIDSRVLFVALVALVAVQRLVELAVSNRNLGRVLARGGVERGARLYPWMVAMHAGFLVCGPVEVIALGRSWIPALGAAMGALLLLAQALRYWTIGALGARWTTRVVHVPGEPLVATGPYRWIRHPNYVAVAIEFVALPLIHTAWATAALFSVANAVVLHRRIAVEEAALRGSGRGQEGSRT